MIMPRFSTGAMMISMIWSKWLSILIFQISRLSLVLVVGWLTGLSLQASMSTYCNSASLSRDMLVDLGRYTIRCQCAVGCRSCHIQFQDYNIDRCFDMCARLNASIVDYAPTNCKVGDPKDYIRRRRRSKQPRTFPKRGNNKPFNWASTR